MKVFYYGFVILILSAACKKGKKLSTPLAVQWVTVSEASIAPKDHFPPFDMTDPSEALQYPRYAHDLSKEQIAERFNDDLRSLLSDNNIKLRDDSADYKLVIGTPCLTETLNRHSYTDSCFQSNGLSYVYSSCLNFTVRATLYKQGVLVESWQREGKSWERVKSGVTRCNAPKIGILFRTSGDLITQVAKELRVQISKKLKDLEG